MKNSILFLTHVYPDFSFSIRGIFIRKMVMSLMREEYRISVVTPKIYKGSHFYEEQDGVSIYRFPYLAQNKRLMEYHRIPFLKVILYCISGFLVTCYVLLKKRCHLIHTHWAIPTGIIGALVGDIFRRPFVVTIHGSDHRMAAEKSGLIRKIFFIVCRRAKHVHCVSDSIKEEIEQWGIEKKRISSFPMAVDDSFLEIGKNRKFDKKNEPLTVVSNRNLHSLYNVSLFVRSIPHLISKSSNMQFLIAGEGPEREVLKNKAKELNIESFVSFLGLIPHDEMPSLLGNADIYVSTSTSDGTSVSLLEAMASGAFPIVTNIGSNQKLITDGENGFLVPLENEAYLAEKIIEAGKNIELRKEARHKNLEIIQNLAEGKKNTSKIIKIYEGTFH